MVQFMKKESVQSLNTATKIQVVSGLAWITVAGDLNDYILKAGESFELKQGQHLVIEALRDLRFATTDLQPRLDRVG